MLRHFGKMLELFPFSPENPGENVLRIQAIASTEPAILEQPFPDPLDPVEVRAAAEDFLHDDAAYSLDAWWGLWVYEKDWTLRPVRVTLHCFGPKFADSPYGDDQNTAEHLRIDFGLEARFLPDAELPNSAWYARSNLKGLVQFVHTLEEAVPMERRALWSESGGNLAEKLARAAQDLQ